MFFITENLLFWLPIRSIDLTVLLSDKPLTQPAMGIHCLSIKQKVCRGRSVGRGENTQTQQPLPESSPQLKSQVLLARLSSAMTELLLSGLIHPLLHPCRAGQVVVSAERAAGCLCHSSMGWPNTCPIRILLLGSFNALQLRMMFPMTPFPLRPFQVTWG